MKRTANDFLGSVLWIFSMMTEGFYPAQEKSYVQQYRVNQLTAKIFWI